MQKIAVEVVDLTRQFGKKTAVNELNHDCLIFLQHKIG